MWCWLVALALAQDLRPPDYLIAPPPPPVRPEVVVPPWVGVYLAPGSRGVLVDRVYPGFAGAKAGLQANDEVLAIDGIAMTRVQDFVATIAAHAVGDEVTLHLLRDGAELDLTFALEARPDAQTVARAQWLGEPLPAILLPTTIGPYPADSHALLGKVVVIELFTAKCRACMASMPRLSNWNDAYSAGLRVLAITAQDWWAVTPSFAVSPVPFTVASDPSGKLTRTLGVRTVPTFLVVDKGGVIRYIGVGTSAMDEVERLLVPLLDAPVADITPGGG